MHRNLVRTTLLTKVSWIVRMFGCCSDRSVAIWKLAFSDNAPTIGHIVRERVRGMSQKFS